MNLWSIESSLNSKAHADDLVEAADFMLAMLHKTELEDTLEHYECLATRLKSRGEAIAKQTGTLL